MNRSVQKVEIRILKQFAKYYKTQRRVVRNYYSLPQTKRDMFMSCLLISCDADKMEMIWALGRYTAGQPFAYKSWNMKKKVVLWGSYPNVVIGKGAN